MEEKKRNNTNKIVSIVVVAVVIIVAIVISVVFLNKGNDENKNTANGITNSVTETNKTGQNNTPDTFNINNNIVTGPIDAPNNDVPLNSVSTPTEGNSDQVQGSVSTD